MLDAKAVAEVLGCKVQQVCRIAGMIRANGESTFGVQSGLSFKYRSWEIDRIKAALPSQGVQVMTTKYANLEVWIAVDESGTYVCGCNEDELQTRWAEDIGGEAGGSGVRRVKLTVKVPLPEVIELTGEVQCDESATGLEVK